MRMPTAYENYLHRMEDYYKRKKLEKGKMFKRHLKF